jgi:thiamine biosynthesis protein ThiS
LVQDLELEFKQIAIELNGQIVNRKGWSQQVIGQGDRVEIVRFVGGGERKEKCPTG